MTVAEAQERISSSEFAEWRAYSTISPWGELRADLRQALLLTLLANAFGSEKDDPARLEDFILEADGAPRIAERNEKRAQPDEGAEAVALWHKLKAQLGA